MRLRYKLPTDDDDGERGPVALQSASRNHALVLWQVESCPACFSAHGVCSGGLASGFRDRGGALSQFFAFQQQRVYSQVPRPHGGEIACLYFFLASNIIPEAFSSLPFH